MGDMKDYFNDMKEMRKKSRNDKYIESLKRFKLIPYTTKNDGVHWLVDCSGQVFDFYPTTHKWRFRGDGKFKSGIDKFFMKYNKEKA